MMNTHTSMLVEWSAEDEGYVVWCGQFSRISWHASHGATYMEAAKHGQEVLALLIESYAQEGRPLPEPVRYQVTCLGARIEMKT